MSRRRPRVELPLSRSQRQWVAAIGLLGGSGALLWALLAGRPAELLVAARVALGWGFYGLPLLLAGSGVYLALEGLGRPVRVPWARVAAAMAVLLLVLGVTHILAGGPASQYGLAAAGGTLGRWIARALMRAFGRVGAVVVLLTVAIVAAKLAVGVPVARVARALRQGCKALRHLAARWHPGRVPEQWAVAPLPSVERHGAPATRTAPSPSPTRAAQPTRPEPALSPAAAGPEHEPWRLPAIDEVLAPSVDAHVDVADLRARARIIEETMHSLGVPAWVVEVNPGPTVTQFGLEPGHLERRDRQGNTVRSRVRVSQIERLSNDLALALAAPAIRIEAPVPGKSVVGVEVPNRDPALVGLRGVMESDEFRAETSPLAVALGRDVSGDPIVADLCDLPHLLIAGATGAGKSICINALIACLLCRNTPDTLRLLMIDPKRVELSGYDGVPHLVAPVIVDTGRVLSVLRWLLREMDRRYDLLAQSGARDIGRYNEMARSDGEPVLPYVVCFIDELADLMMVSSEDVERSLCRLAQMARATGIHLVVATQRPSVDVLTGLIKANFPARLAFAVSAQVDSRVILDSPGAEKLLGRGDALLMVPDSPLARRLQGCWVGDDELTRLVAHWRAQAGGPLRTAPELQGDASAMVQQTLWPDTAPAEPDDDADPLLQEVVALVREQGRASTSMLQRSLRIGYSRAARLIDALEQMGVVGPVQEGGRSRVVLPAPDLDTPMAGGRDDAQQAS